MSVSLSASRFEMSLSRMCPDDRHESRERERGGALEVTLDGVALLHLVVEELEVRVELRLVAGACLEEVGPHLFPHLQRRVSDEVVDEVEVDQPPLEEHSDLVVEGEDVRAHMSSTDGLDH